MSTADESLVRSEPPLWEVPGWRERFGITAGITGRSDTSGGSFDLGLWTREPVGEVMARWRRIRDAFPEFRGETMAHQVHGTRVLWHPDPGTGWTIHDGADGHVASVPGHLLLITVADCIPVYLAAPGKGVIGLLHAGWRGVASGILERGLQVMHEVGMIDPASVVMHCGVGICGECYEVGHEVVEALGLTVRNGGRPHADLRAALARQARELGVREVSLSGHCTAHERGNFFSHRASGGADGRMVAWIGLLPGHGAAATV